MRLALALTLVALSAPAARAQSAPSLAVRMPPCAPAWWDEAALRAALAVELRAAGVELADVDASSGSLELALAGACETSARVDAIVRDGAGTSSRSIDLADVPEAARARALAMAVGALVTEPRELAPPPDEAVPTPDPAPEPVARTRRASSLGDPAAPPPERAPPSSALPEPPSDLPIALELAGVLAIAPASGTPLGGPHLALIARVFGPLFLHVAVSALFASAQDPLGEVRAIAIAGTLGAGVEGRIDVVRIAGYLGWSLGWAQLEGASATPGVLTGTSAEVLSGLDVGLRGVLDLAREVGLVLEIDCRILAAGLEARSPSGPVVALRDALVTSRIGVELRL